MKNNASLVYNFCLILGDALAITVAFTIAYILRVSLDSQALSASVSSQSYITILVSLLPFWILTFGLLGLYNSRIYDKRIRSSASGGLHRYLVCYQLQLHYKYADLSRTTSNNL
jgi:hypothetical protein